MSRKAALRRLDHVAPKLDVRVIAIAEDQHEYMTIYGGLVTHPAFGAGHPSSATTVATQQPGRTRT